MPPQWDEDTPTLTIAPALSRYLDLIRANLLTRAFRTRITDRESRQDYPFSLHNIYRILLAAGPVLVDGWLAIAAAQPLTADEPELGTSFRCFRYLHALLASTAAKDRTALVPVLETMAVRAVGMVGEPYCFGVAHPEPDLATPGNSPELALRLATVLRQYTDTRWFGQHDHGFLGHQPTHVESAAAGQPLTCYVRCFGRLPTGFGRTNVSVVVTYGRNANTDGFNFDVMRGEIVSPPDRGAVVHCAVFGTTVADDDADIRTEVLTDAECATLLRRATAGLRAVHADHRGIDRATAEHAVADLFCRELSDTARRAGLDDLAWRTAVHTRLADLPHERGSVAGRYLDQLGRTVNQWSDYLCAGN